MRAHPAGPLHGNIAPPPAAGPAPADLGALDPQVWPRSARRVDGELHLAGRPVTELAREHGTPLFVLDEADFRGRAAASGTSRSISSKESSTTCPMPASTASCSSTRDLLLPCRAIRPAGKPAASATASSLPLQASRCRPSAAIHRATWPQRNALEA